MATILSGIPLRDKIKEDLSTAVSFLAADSIPTLAIIQVGRNESSSLYIKGKIAFGKDIGIPVELHSVEEGVTEEEVTDFILRLNADAKVGGIIVQLPLPEGMNEERIMEVIDPSKDVDGLHSVNVKKLLVNDASGIVPATTRGIISLLKFNGIELKGRKVLMIGRSPLVGRPTALACLNEDATVTIAHHLSVDLSSLCKEADVIIVATGVPGLITRDHVKAGQTVIDVGITRQDGKVVGDVLFDEVAEIVSGISPVPGGVGPLTIASLFQNLLKKYNGDITNN